MNCNYSRGDAKARRTTGGSNDEGRTANVEGNQKFQCRMTKELSRPGEDWTGMIQGRATRGAQGNVLTRFGDVSRMDARLHF